MWWNAQETGVDFSERALTPTLIFFHIIHPPTHTHTYIQSHIKSFHQLLLVYQFLSPDPSRTITISSRSDDALTPQTAKLVTLPILTR